MEELKNGDPCYCSDYGMVGRAYHKHYIGVGADGRHYVDNGDSYEIATSIQPKTMRPMTRCEMIAWASRVTMDLATNPDGDVWVVDWSAKGEPTSELGDGCPPMSINYTDANWWRSRLDKATGKPVKWERMETEVE